MLWGLIFLRVGLGSFSMAIDGFKRLYHDADRRAVPATVAVAGGDDLTVLEAMRIATDSGWIRPILVGPEPRIRELAKANEIELDDFTIRHAEGDAIAAAAVSVVRAGEARALMKGQIATPALMKAVLHHDQGLRTGRVVCQVVLMEVPRDRRRFLLADTGISVTPNLHERIDILRSTVAVAGALWEPTPKVARMAATETIKPSMPETVEAAQLVQRNQEGELADCLIEGPLSFDLAYAADAGAKKGVESSVVGAADIMLFPNLLSANLTVKAIMYTADCEFGGVLRGTSAPVVFMSRADTTETRLNSLALTLRILDH
jgi:phosphate butyryltransferase